MTQWSFWVLEYDSVKLLSIRVWLSDIVENKSITHLSFWVLEYDSVKLHKELEYDPVKLLSTRVWLSEASEY